MVICTVKTGYSIVWPLILLHVYLVVSFATNKKSLTWIKNQKTGLVVICTVKTGFYRLATHLQVFFVVSFAINEKSLTWIINLLYQMFWSIVQQYTMHHHFFVSRTSFFFLCETNNMFRYCMLKVTFSASCSRMLLDYTCKMTAA